MQAHLQTESSRCESAPAEDPLPIRKTVCCVESIGVKYPEQIVTTSEILDRLNVKGVPKLELLTGIKRRRKCEGHEDSLTLAVDAIEDCLRYSRFAADDIEMVVYCSISKYVGGITHHYEPPLSTLIKQQTGMNRALSFDVSNACAGMMTGAQVALDFITQGVVSNCLVVSGEYISSISDNAEKNISSAQHPELASLTVGDAGAAVIFSKAEAREESILVSEMVTLSQFSRLCMGSQASEQPGGCMVTDMKGIHAASIDNAPYFIEQSLEKAGLRMRDIDYLIPHQTAKRAITSGARSFARYFREKPGTIVINLEETGNTASTTHFATLGTYLKEGRIKQGDRVMLLSFSSGLVIGVMILEINGIRMSDGIDR